MDFIQRHWFNITTSITFITASIFQITTNMFDSSILMLLLVVYLSVTSLLNIGKDRVLDDYEALLKSQNETIESQFESLDEMEEELYKCLKKNL